jgi:zinc transport system substrate-binding protein
MTKWRLAKSGLILQAILFFSIGCQKPSLPVHPKIRVMTSIFPIYDIIQNISESYLDVAFAVPVAANPHTYELEPSIVRNLKQANIYIGISHEFDGWIVKYLSKQAAVYFIQDSLERNHKLDLNPHNNPHIWLSIQNAKKIAQIITKILSDADPENSAEFEANCKSYQSKLSDLDNKIKTLFSDIPDKNFIQWHPAWDYFAEAYGLNITGTIEHGHGDEPSVKQFKEMIHSARKNHVRIIVIGLNVESKAAGSLANEIKGQLIRLDTIGDPDQPERSDYIDLMTYNAKQLSEALRH